MSVTRNFVFHITQVSLYYIVMFKLNWLAMKGYSWQAIKYFVRFINVWYILSECLFMIGAETWEELAGKNMKLGHSVC